MYTCIEIETDHGLDVLKQFLLELKQDGDLPLHYNNDIS